MKGIDSIGNYLMWKCIEYDYEYILHRYLLIMCEFMYSPLFE